MELSQRARNGQVLSGFFTFLVLAPPVVLAVMATNTMVRVTIGRPSCWLSLTTTTTAPQRTSTAGKKRKFSALASTL